MRKNATPAGRQGFTPLIIILVIAVLGVVGYLFYKNYQVKIGSLPIAPPLSSDVSTQKEMSNSVSDWKTFTSSLYGFTIKYPQSIKPPQDEPWITPENGEPSGSGVMSFDLSAGQSLWITVWPNPSGLSIHDWGVQNVKSGGGTLAIIGDVTINGQPAYQKMGNVGDGEMKDTYFVQGKYLIEIQFYESNANYPDYEKNKAIFEQMLSTFKITE